MEITKYLNKIIKYKIIIVAAGMDGALPSVLGGLIPDPIISIPTSTGYGVSNQGKYSFKFYACKLCARADSSKYR